MTISIFDGVTVLETGAGSMAASVAGMVLADYGARVLKIEPPGGDRLRTQWPPGFMVWNRGKESVVADLHTSEGRQLVRELAAAADVFVDGFGAGRADGWGVGDAELRGANPRLVYCSIKGFSSSGAYAGIKGYEGVVAAKTGMFSLGDWGYRPGPLFTSTPYANVGAAHFAVSGITAALLVREQTGRGQRVEATLAQGVTPCNYFGLMLWQQAMKPELLDKVKGEYSPREGGVVATRTMAMPCTADGRWFMSTMMLPHQAQALQRAADLDALRQDSRFTDAPYFGSAEDAQAWEDIVLETFRGRTWEEWLPRLLAEDDISFERMGTAENSLDHPQLVHNGDVIELDDPEVGPVRQIGPVARFTQSPARITRSAPRIGEHRQLPVPAPLAAGDGAAPRSPFDGITIVEFGYFYAMPFGTTLAASLGARVIKLEDRNGDPMRSAFGPPEFTACKTMEGKESLALDLRTAEGRKIVHQLIEKADAFVHGFRPGVTERLGIDYPTLSAINPRLVYFHAPSYGVDGPYAHRPTYASEAAAVGGVYHRQAGFWLDPSITEGMSAAELQAICGARLRAGQTPGDAFAALAVFSSLSCALLHQRRTGQGQFLSRSMIGANCFGFSDDFNAYEGKPSIPIPDSENFGTGALYRLYQTADGWVFLAVTTEAEWEAFVAAVGGTLADDTRFTTAAARRAADSDLAVAIAELLGSAPAHDWEAKLTPAGVACVHAFETTQPRAAASMSGMSEFTLTDPVIRQLGLVTEVDHPVLGRIARHGLPIEFSETPGRIAPGCRTGQHTEAILTELGYTPDMIAKLHADDIVSIPR